MAKRKYRNRDEWKALIEAQMESGLSAAKFCSQQQINAKYFSKRKTQTIRLADKPELASAFVKIQPAVQTTQSTAIHLHYKNTHVQIPSSIAPAWLADFLGLLS